METEIRLLFVGDVMLGRQVNHLLRKVPPQYPWGDTTPLFRNSDWRMCNLECAISDRGTPWARTEKAFHFASDAKNVAVLQAAQIDAVALANNHVLDFDYEGLFETLTVLDRAGVKHAGAGRDLNAAIKPAISEVKGTKIGVIAFTDNQPEWEAAAAHPGIFYLPIDASDERASLLLDTISRVRKNVEILVVSGHWGPNWGYEPLAAHVKFGHLLVDAGADIIFGHSGHVFQGIEPYRGGLIIYCAGNFIDDYAIDEVERNDESFIFLVHVKNGRISGLTLFPTVIAGCQARLARGRQCGEIAFKMASLCVKLGTRTEWHEAERALEIRIGR